MRCGVAPPPKRTPGKGRESFSLGSPPTAPRALQADASDYLVGAHRWDLYNVTPMSHKCHTYVSHHCPAHHTAQEQSERPCPVC